MRIWVLILLAMAGTVRSEIVYPVDVEGDRFTFQLGTNVVRGVKWPRADGMALEAADTNLVVLREVRAADPVFDPATERLGPGFWADDEAAQTATWTRTVVALTQEELDARAEAEADEAKRVNLANGIATLRTWADQAEATTVTSGNAVATLQTVVDRLGIFFDHFADLLEAQDIEP